jgi:hypothetical protein
MNAAARGCDSRPAGAACLLVPLAVVLAACDLHVGELRARATDEWTHTYPLKAGGEIRIANTNGRIDVEAADGSTVEVRAEKIAKGATETAARELLPRIVIREKATPDRVSIETERLGGIMIGASFEVRYHVKAPAGAVIDVENTNGQVVLTRLAGRVTARTTNGAVRGDGLRGAVDARTTNGAVTMDLAGITDTVRLRTTNGGLTVRVPESAKADLEAQVTNGGISVGEFDALQVEERSRRRLEAKLNGGGPTIDLQTTNGAIRIRPRDGTADADTDRDRTDDDNNKPKTR